MGLREKGKGKGEGARGVEVGEGGEALDGWLRWGERWGRVMAWVGVDDRSIAGGRRALVHTTTHTMKDDVQERGKGASGRWGGGDGGGHRHARGDGGRHHHQASSGTREEG